MKLNKKHIHRENTYTIISKEHANMQEIYRNVRTNIEFSSLDHKLSKISVTSSQAHELKTTFILNLAMSFASKYPKVLLIDCDLRKPVIHKYLKLSNTYGLTNALVSYAKDGKIDSRTIMHIKDASFISTLDVIVAGSKTPNPNEILSSEVFKSFINDLSKDYDYILFDCPPILAVSDAIPVGTICDGTLFVYSSADTNKKDAALALDMLKKNNISVIGGIMTKAEIMKNRYYNYGYY